MKLSTALSVFALTSLFGIGAFGTPDCQWTDTFTSATAGASRANTSAGNAPCVAFRVTYQAEGMTALSIQIEGAPDVAGAPGAWVIIPSTAIMQGTNPLTGATSGTLVVDGAVYYPWMRMHVTVFTPTGPSGSITDRVYGYKGTSAGLSGGSIPIGPCGGDLSGAFPNCTVVGVNGALVPHSAGALGSNAAGQLIDVSAAIPAADGNTSVQYNSGGLLAGDSTQFAWFETSIGTPTAPVVTQHGAAGAVTYAYQIAWLTLAGNGPGGAITTTTTGNAVLSGTNYNIITPPACPANASGYIVVRITDPNSNTGVLPVLGTCGAPVNDVYPSLVSAMFNIPLPDQSTGLYSTQITTPVGMFGSSVFPLNSLIGEYFGSGPGYPLISIATTATTVYPTAGQFYADDLTGGAGSLIQGLQSIAVSNGADGTTAGVLFVAAHNGAANNTASLYGGYGGLFNEDAGNVPGWSAIYEGNNVTTSSTGRFADAAAFDVPAGLFSNSTSTGVNAVLHSLQAPTVPISYFLLEEGGIPSKLAGSLTITPLKSTTGQRFVCVDNAGLLHSSTTACVGT